MKQVSRLNITYVVRLLYTVGHQSKDLMLEWGILEHGDLDLPKFKLVSESLETVVKHYATGM